MVPVHANSEKLDSLRSDQIGDDFQNAEANLLTHVHESKQPGTSSTPICCARRRRHHLGLRMSPGVASPGLLETLTLELQLPRPHDALCLRSLETTLALRDVSLTPLDISQMTRNPGPRRVS